MASGIKYSINNFHMSFKKNLIPVFYNNYDGVINGEKNFHKSYEKASTTVFSSNNAYTGGTIYSYDNSYIFLKEILLQC